MQIQITDITGHVRPIADTRWSPLAAAMETVARDGGRSGRGPRGGALAVLAWCRHAGTTRPAVDDVILADGVLTLNEYDPEAVIAFDPAGLSG